MAHRYSICVLWMIGGLLMSCGGSCAKDPIVSVEVVFRPDNRLDHARVEAGARDAARHLPGFALRDSRPGEARWEMVVETQLDRDNMNLITGMRLVALEAPKKGSPGQYEAEASTKVDATQPDALNQGALRTIDQAAQSLARVLTLYRASDAQILSTLSQKDKDLRLKAIGIAADRQLVGAVPVLSAIVESEDEDTDTVLRSVGALVAIGDERAVNSFIRAAEHRRPVFLNSILFALAQLGGKEAEAYLFTVASGHADVDVRQNARDALVELERRKHASKPSK